MKIWVISRSYPTKSNQMRGSFELEQAKLLAKHGHDVSLVCVVFHPLNKVKKWGYCSFTDENVRVYVHSVPFFPERMHVHLTGFQGGFWKRLLAKAEAEQGIPDIIHIHYPAMVSIADPVLSYQQKGTKVVLTDHWTRTLINTMDNYQRGQLKKYVEAADAAICVSKPLKDALIRVTGTKRPVHIVPNVVSCVFAESISDDKNTYDGAFTFISISRLAPVKQVDKIVRAFAQAFDKSFPVRLLIVGGGKEAEKIKKIVSDCSVADRVELTGTLPRDKVAQKLSAAQALVCFSRIETFGVPVVEAWTCGKPVVTADSVCYDDKWDDALGELVHVDDMDALIAAMQKVYDQYASYDPTYISQYAVSRFGEEAVYNSLIRIYSDLIK